MAEDELKDRANARARARREKRRRQAEAATPAPRPRVARRRVSEQPSSAPGGAPVIGRLATDRESVLAVNAMFYRAFEVRDIELMGDVWAKEPHVRCIHPGWEPLAGWDEVVGSWEQIFGGLETLRFELAEVTVRVGGSLAWVELCEMLEAIHDGQPARSTVLATNIFERQPDGRWRMIHHHASPVMVRQPTPKRRGGESIH